MFNLAWLGFLMDLDDGENSEYFLKNFKRIQNSGHFLFCSIVSWIDGEETAMLETFSLYHLVKWI